ncbi:hypothetical protein [Streptomyces phage phiScoe15]|nr:hypothetical protein [Streptomyces phage phiScoe15]
MSITRRGKFVSAFLILAVGFGIGQTQRPADAKPQDAVTVQTVASAKPQPIAVKVPVPDLPTRECTPDGGRNCYWDGGEIKGKQPSYWVDRNGRVTYLQPKLNDQTKRRLWEASQRKKGAEEWGTVDGHRFCWAVIGDTSYVKCWDGYKTTS